MLDILLHIMHAAMVSENQVIAKCPIDMDIVFLSTNRLQGFCFHFICSYSNTAMMIASDNGSQTAMLVHNQFTIITAPMLRGLQYLQSLTDLE